MVSRLGRTISVLLLCAVILFLFLESRVHALNNHKNHLLTNKQQQEATLNDKDDDDKNDWSPLSMFNNMNNEAAAADNNNNTNSEFIFTKKSMEVINSRLLISSAKMIVIHLPKLSAEEEKSTTQVDGNNALKPTFKNGKRSIYVVDSKGLLFLQPYSRFFTQRTISESFFYDSLTFSEHGTSQDLQQRMNMTFLRDVFMRESVMNDLLKKSQYYVCFVTNRNTYSKYQFSLSNIYNCLTISRSDPLDPASLMESIESVESPRDSMIVEYAFEVLRYLVIFFMIKYLTRKLRVIQRASKTKNMSNSLYRPPFWQNLLSGVPAKTVSNFRIWEGLWLLCVFTLLYTLMVISVIVPNDWPEKSFAKIYTIERLKFLSLTIPVIAINFWCAVLKLLLAARKQTQTYETKAQNLFARAFKVLFALFISSLAGIGWLTYAYFSESDLIIEKIAIHVTAAVVIIISLVIILHRSPVYKLNAFVVTVLEKLCCRSSQRKEKALDMFQYYFYLMCSYTLDIFWFMSCVVVAFNAGGVVGRFAWSTVSNFLLNSDSVKTYGYLVSLAATVYKFSNDIEMPYATMREFVFTDRPSMNAADIEKNNNRLSQLTEEELKLVPADFYYSPISWTQFTRLAKMSHINQITNGSLLQGFITLFVICLFYLAAQTFNSDLFSSKSNNVLFGIVTGTIMPLIPQLISFFNNGVLAMNSPVFKSRYNKALVMLEAEQKQIMMKTMEDYKNLDRMPVRFAILNVVKNEEGKSLIIERLKTWKNMKMRTKNQTPLSVIEADDEYLLMDGELLDI